MKCNRRQTKTFIWLLDWTPSTFRTEKTLIFAHSYRPLSVTPGDLCCTSPSLTAFVFDHFCLSLFVLGSRGCVWVRCCSKHTVLRARSDHVGSFSASSGGHTGCINRQRDESPARVTCYFGCFARAAVGPWQVSLEAAEFTCLTWWRGKVILTRCDKLEVGLQSGDGAPGTNAAVSRKTSSK